MSLAVLLVAYVLFSGTLIGKVADASGARPSHSFNAMWFANPAAASRPVPAGRALEVVIANQTHADQTLHWSASSAGTTLERGAIQVARAGTETVVVPTKGARPGRWFTVGLDGTSVAIKAMIAS